MINFLDSARIVAIGRVALALSLLVLAVTDPGHGGFYWEPDDLISLAYLLVALLGVALAYRDWWLDHCARGALLAADLLIFILLPSLIEPLVDGYRIASLTTATFIELAVALRWNWRIAGIAAVVINILNWLLTTYRPVASLTGQIPAAFVHVEHTDYIRSIYYLLLISLLIVWVGSRISVPRASKLLPSRNAYGLVLLEEALDYALRVSAGGKGAIAWKRADASSAVQFVAEPPIASETTRLVVEEIPTQDSRPPTLFDLRRGRQIQVMGEELRASKMSPDTGMMMTLAGRTPGFMLPIDGVSGRGSLLVYDVKSPSTDALKLLLTAGKEIADAIDRQQARRLDREEAFVRLRHKLARDLHDSVAQSLAGTRFWLRNLSNKSELPEAVESELEKIDHALDSEAEHLRLIIARLRDEGVSFAGDPIQDLRELSATLAAQWRMEVRMEIGTETESIEIGQDLAFEIAQMIREGVSNAARHGRASEVVISLKSYVQWLYLSLVDNGVGFPDPQNPRPPRMLSQRLDELGGSLTVVSSAQGSRLDIMLPMEGTK